MSTTREAKATSDKQLVEIAGRNLLVSALVAAGLEVARPERDRGVDLLAYLDLEQDLPFTAVPIQLKASEGTGVSLLRKYEKFGNLLTVLAWHVLTPHDSCFYALGPADVTRVAEQMRWSATKSWSGGHEPGMPHPKGGYHVTRAGRGLVEMLEEFRICAPVDWRSKILELAAEGR